MPYIQFTLLFVSGMMQPGASTFKERLDAGQARFSDKWRLGFSASLCYWPLVNSVMYSLVQPRFMNLYADLASLIFASVMSYITYNDCANVAVRGEKPTFRSGSLMLPTKESLAEITAQTQRMILMKSNLLKERDSVVSKKAATEQLS